MAERIDRIGQRFGDYVLHSRLGGGSFGDVYLGEQVHEHSLAAVKVLHVRLTRSEDLRAFINEVRTFRLQHPHIVRMLDVGLTQDETPFLVMTYAPGGTLRDRHPKGSRLSPAQVLGYVLPIASALQYAHDLHLIHRDVKPENMLLGAREELWLSDFGIVTVAHSTHSLSTEAMGGTVPYMAPEQIQGMSRPQSDQYALAIVVYEWLTGTWPFRGTAFEIAMQHQMTPPPALRTYRSELAPEVEQVVLTALAKDPKQRFASVLAFARALEQASQAEPTLVEPPSVPLIPDATSRVLQEEQHLPAEEERVRQAREEKQVSQVKQPEPAPVVPVSEATDTNSSQQPTERATPVPLMPVSQQTVGEVSTDIPSQPQTILPSSGEERLRQTGEERRQAEEETARQEEEQADTLEEERARKAEETVSDATEPATSAHQTPLPTEVARASKPSPLRPDAMVVVKPAKPSATQRFVLLGLAGLVIVALASGIAWFTTHPASPTAGIPAAPTASIPASPTASIPAAPALSITEFPLPTSRQLFHIAAGHDGNLWFTEVVYNQQYELIGSKIGRISPSGTITEFSVPTAKSGPDGITAGPDGNLWFRPGVM